MSSSPNSESIEVHFNPKSGQLTLTCGEAVFCRLREAVWSTAMPTESAEAIINAPLTAVRYIDIESATYVAPGRLMPMIGCAAFTLAMLTSWGIGVVTVIKSLFG